MFVAGIFLSINQSSCVGLCHKSELADDGKITMAAYSPGDYVKAIVLALDEKKKQISLGLKPSYFDEMDEGEDMDEGGEGMDAGDDAGSDATEESNGTTASSETTAFEINSFDTGEEALEVAEEPIDIGITPHNMDVDGANIMPEESQNDKSGENDGEEAAGELSGSEDNQLDDASDDQTESDDETPIQDASESESDSESESESEPEQKAAEKHRTDEEVKRSISDVEESVADSTAPLMTEADYQREVIASPNSSISWIKYMAFQLSAGEVDKAREVVEKALKTISFRNDRDKLNVWIASLNLEKQYGTQTTLMQMFERAILYNDAKTVYVQLVEILKVSQSSEDLETIESLYHLRQINIETVFAKIST